MYFSGIQAMTVSVSASHAAGRAPAALPIGFAQRPPTDDLPSKVYFTQMTVAVAYVRLAYFCPAQKGGLSRRRSCLLAQIARKVEFREAAR